MAGSVGSLAGTLDADSLRRQLSPAIAALAEDHVEHDPLSMLSLQLLTLLDVGCPAPNNAPNNAPNGHIETCEVEAQSLLWPDGHVAAGVGLFAVRSK